MGTELEREAPNVVSEPFFRKLMERGHRAEIVCQSDAYYKASVWYGEWTLRAINDDRSFDKVLVTNPRRAAEADEIKVRVFRTINGLSSFIHKLGFSHIDVPFHRGGRSLLALPDTKAGTDRGTADDS